MDELYQTVADRDNIPEILRRAPFPCDRSNSWLGDGYYFWEHFIENAHWWGRVGYKNKYIICKYECEITKENCFDLSPGAAKHISDFTDAWNKMKETGSYNLNNTTVKRVLSYWKSKIGGFKYEAVKAIGEDVRHDQDFTVRFLFNQGKKPNIDLTPPIQICIFKKNGLSLSAPRIDFRKKNPS